jgi:hypothetical protein
MKQSRISALENVSYDSWSIKTLRRLAEAFDLVLVVRFESFGKVIEDIESFERTRLEAPSFTEDPAFDSRSPGQQPSIRKESGPAPDPQPHARLR